MEKMIQIIMNTLPGGTLSEDACEAVLKRLESFGYTVEEKDAWVICFVMQKVENHINNACNTTSIPDGLFHVAVDKVCGEFLFVKKQTGQLEIENLDLTSAIKQISAGDTSVSFADDVSDEEKFNQLLNYLITKGEGDFVCYRRIKW